MYNHVAVTSLKSFLICSTLHSKPYGQDRSQQVLVSAADLSCLWNEILQDVISPFCDGDPNLPLSEGGCTRHSSTCFLYHLLAGGIHISTSPAHVGIALHKLYWLALLNATHQTDKHFWAYVLVEIALY